MSQALSPESQSGPLQLMVGDQSFTVSQRMIMLGAQKTRELGVLPKDLPGFPPLVLKGANAINAMLNSKAVEAKVDSSSMNIFFFELGKFDSVFLRVSMKTGPQTGDFMEMLILPSGSGGGFVDALQNIDKPTMQKLVGETIRIHSDQRVNDSSIVAENLIIFPQSTTQLAESAFKNPASVPSLYDRNKNGIIVHKIPLTSEAQAEEDIDLSEFVKQSVFFRNEQGPADLTPTQKPHEIKESDQKIETTEEPEQKNQLYVRKAEKVETKDEGVLMEIANSVSEPGIYGKFSKPVITPSLHSPTMPDNYMDFNTFTNQGKVSGSSFAQTHDPTGRLWYFQGQCYENYRRKTDDQYYTVPDGLDFKSSLIFAHILDSRSPDAEQLMIEVPVTDMDASHRPHHFTVIYCTLPKEKCNQLISLIEKNPVNAERFIQVAFDGIDNFTERIPIETVSIVDVAEYVPKQHQYIKDGRYNNQGMYKLKKSDHNTNAVTTLHYPQPLPKIQKS